MKQALLTAGLLVAMLVVRGGSVAGDERAFPEWQPPLPQDGIERPAPGLLAMPRELVCWGTTLRRLADVEADSVRFRYEVRPPGASGGAPGTLTVHSFREARRAHAQLEGLLRQSNMSGTPWTKMYERAELPDLVYRLRQEGREPRFLGVVRHTFFHLELRFAADLSEAERQDRARATAEAARDVVQAIEAAASALDGVRRTIGEVSLERLPSPSPTWSDQGELRLTVLPRPRSFAPPESVRVLLCWRLPGAPSSWHGKQAFVAWHPTDPGLTHGRAPAIPLSPREAETSRLELLLLRAHDEGATFALEEIRFEIAEGARTAKWTRSR